MNGLSRTQKSELESENKHRSQKWEAVSEKGMDTTYSYHFPWGLNEMEQSRDCGLQSRIQSSKWCYFSELVDLTEYFS